MKDLIARFCLRDDLSSYDPYDIWKTPCGFQVKKMYNRSPLLGIVPAALLSAFDNLLNNERRWSYTRIDYPIVRAQAALCLLNLYRESQDPRAIEIAKKHLLWLLDHSCPGYSGFCWGLGFQHAVSRSVIYDRLTPLSTITPYAMEAFATAARMEGGDCYRSVVESIFQFVDSDLKIMEEDEETMATSYGPFRDRTVVNAVSYTMYCYALFLPFAPQWRRQQIQTRIRKLYEYLRRHQEQDGSWFYSPDGRSFVDCFHSCIVLKNIIKTRRWIHLEDSENLVDAGFRYLLRSFLDERDFLFRRFSVANKPGVIRYDLYDNAELLNVAVLLKESVLAQRLLDSILQHFCKGEEFYSQIDVLGCRRNRNTLRWAVMPFLLAASQMISSEDTWTLPLPANAVTRPLSALTQAHCAN